MRFANGTDRGAPTVRYNRQGGEVRSRPLRLYARDGRRTLTPAEANVQKERIEAVGQELNALAEEGEIRHVSYDEEIEPLLRHLHKLGFFPVERFVNGVALAINGAEIAAAAG